MGGLPFDSAKVPDSDAPEGQHRSSSSRSFSGTCGEFEGEWNLEELLSRVEPGWGNVKGGDVNVARVGDRTLGDSVWPQPQGKTSARS